ncbi:hypothetical protein GOP47_0016439 [Adiantum capillus-veneris]|uniref:Uncharacterized protein n=1 Tax=Adiantum capillus-veneris TaxID=13818 RepID=A0A9D4ZAR0_ADICA|nr:hypothetical protein GOP47_0016439 [Adiantum capillus-veneris]
MGHLEAASSPLDLYCGQNRRSGKQTGRLVLFCQQLRLFSLSNYESGIGLSDSVCSSLTLLLEDTRCSSSQGTRAHSEAKYEDVRLCDFWSHSGMNGSISNSGLVAWAVA